MNYIHRNWLYIEFSIIYWQHIASAPSKKFTENPWAKNKNNKHHTNLKRTRERERKNPQIKILEYHFFSPPAAPPRTFFYIFMLLYYFFNTLHFVPLDMRSSHRKELEYRGNNEWVRELSTTSYMSVCMLCMYVWRIFKSNDAPPF